MDDLITPIQKQSLSDNLARKINELIISSHFQSGDRLPTTAELARRFGVGQPTIREAIKKLETVGVLIVKHGSGIYVGDQVDSLFLPNPIILDELPTKKLLLDLIEARTIIEVQASSAAAHNATEDNFKRMKTFLKKAKENLSNEDVLNDANMAFHREIALASGNYVLFQIASVLSKLFRKEQRLLIDIYMSMQDDYEQHVEILEILLKRDGKKAGKQMEKHLSHVRDAILRWDPARTSIRIKNE